MLSILFLVITTLLGLLNFIKCCSGAKFVDDGNNIINIGINLRPALFLFFGLALVINWSLYFPAIFFGYCSTGPPEPIWERNS